jgi:hypothetical protein
VSSSSNFCRLNTRAGAVDPTLIVIPAKTGTHEAPAAPCAGGGLPADVINGPAAIEILYPIPANKTRFSVIASAARQSTCPLAATWIAALRSQ